MEDFLRRNRPELNSMYESFCSMNRGGGAQDVPDLFRMAVAPLYEKDNPPRDEIVRGIFGEVLNLACRGFIGRYGRSGNADECMFRIMRCHENLLVSQSGFMTSVFNALYNICVKGGSFMELWSDFMTSGWRAGDAGEFRKAGFTAAWRCGLARCRDEALNAAELISVDLFNEIFTPALPQYNMKELLSLMKADPWFNPALADGGGPVSLYTDGHRGFGGSFAGIPAVYAHDGVLYAEDRGSVFRIYADCFGVEAVREPEPVPGMERNVPHDDLSYIDGKFCYNDKMLDLPAYCRGEVMSFAAAGTTIAWTMNNSYKIYIAGLGGNHG